MKLRFANIAALLALALATAPSQSEDIDLFVGAQTTSQDLPNVLFVIDNTANWNQAFANEMSALANTFENMQLNKDGSPKFNVGIMLATETGSPNNNVKGGYVRAAIRPMTEANRKLYAALIRSLDKLGDKGDGGYSALTMAEAFRYFSSGVPYAGNNKVKTDFFQNKYGSAETVAVHTLAGNALTGMSATKYSLSTAKGCAKNFIIYISNGPNQQNSSTDTLANSMLAEAGGKTTQLPLSPNGSQSNPSDEWARFMQSSAYGIATYTIDVNPVLSGQGPGWTEMLKSMSRESKGKYAEVNSSKDSGKEIDDAVGDALSEIQATNSVFASVSLPLSVNTQGTYLNQVYVGMFRPDEHALPRWTGNLKQYKLGYVSEELRLQDADNESAINPSTGFITGCGRSFWTPTTTDKYWSFLPMGDCTDALNVSNSPDGNIVEKGAHAFVLRNTSARTVKTCSAKSFDLCDDGLTDFSTTNKDIVLPGVSTVVLPDATQSERDQLIDWSRGKDLDDENDNDDSAERRPFMHGDVVHSRPVAIDLGSAGSPKVLVFYGGNDGMFRAINGNRDAKIGEFQAGSEIWSFMPPEFYGQIKRLRDNETKINFPNVSGTTLPKPYGIDGAITAYRGDGEAWLYASMRRGGRALYAFDVKASKPSDITIKWKKGCPTNLSATGAADDTGCTSGFSGIGQTWSAPKTLTAAGYGSAPLLILGGGYDTCEDALPQTCTSASKGNHVYVLDADTGALLNTLDTDRSVVADIQLVPDASGAAIYAYVVDMGGNIYRIDIGAKAPSTWEIKKIAALGCASGTSCTFNRKFMFAPDFIAENGGYTLLLGSGDREKPRNYSNAVDNYFFKLTDKPSDPNWLSSEKSNCGAEVLCLNSLTPILTEDDPTAAQLLAKKGWYLGLRSTEQVVTSAITIFGTVTFSTHQPSVAQAGVCSSDLGTARVYNVSYLDASAVGGSERSEELPHSIGLPPSPVAGMVQLDNGQTVPFCIGCRPESPLEGEEKKPPPSSAPSQPKSRVYWYIQR